MTLSATLRARIAQLAAEARSTARTLRGQLRAAVAYRRTGRGREYARPLAVIEYLRASTAPTSSAGSDRARRADPDAKRARDDRRYRGPYLARLRREERRLCAAPAPTALREWSDGVVAARARLGEIARLRAIATGRAAAAPAKTYPVLLVPIDADACRQVGYRPYGRCRDHALVPSRKPSRLDHRAAVTEWRNGHPRTAVSACARDYVRSVAAIAGPDLHYMLHTQSGVCSLPEGWCWDVDAQGLRAVRPDGADHHVSARDLLAGVPELIATVERQAAARREAAALAEREAAELADVEVCAVDARRAGNCREGIAAWAAGHAIPVDRHVPAPVLVRLALHDPQESRVRLTLRVAAARHKRETTLGYCLLAEHRA